MAFGDGHALHAVHTALELHARPHAVGGIALAGDGDGAGITATGVPAVRGIAAVDPDVIPLGTRLFIPGYGEAIAADTGGAIVGNKIDLVMDSYGEAMDFGRQDVTVYVLD